VKTKGDQNREERERIEEKKKTGSDAKEEKGTI